MPGFCVEPICARRREVGHHGTAITSTTTPEIYFTMHT